MIYYILINPEEAYPTLCENTSGDLVAFDSGQSLLPITNPHPDFDDYVKYTKEEVDNMQESLYDEDGVFQGELRFPSRKSEEMLRLLKIQAGELNGNS